MERPFYSIKSVCVRDEYKFSCFILNRYIYARTVSRVRACVCSWTRNKNEGRKREESKKWTKKRHRQFVSRILIRGPLLCVHYTQCIPFSKHFRSTYVYVFLYRFCGIQNTIFESLKMTFIDIDAILNAPIHTIHTHKRHVFFYFCTNQNKNKLQIAYWHSFWIYIERDRKREFKLFFEWDEDDGIVFFLTYSLILHTFISNLFIYILFDISSFISFTFLSHVPILFVFCKIQFSNWWKLNWIRIPIMKSTNKPMGKKLIKLQCVKSIWFRCLHIFIVDCWYFLQSDHFSSDEFTFQWCSNGYLSPYSFPFFSRIIWWKRIRCNRKSNSSIDVYETEVSKDIETTMQ